MNARPETEKLPRWAGHGTDPDPIESSARTTGGSTGNKAQQSVRKTAETVRSFFADRERMLQRYCCFSSARFRQSDSVKKPAQITPSLMGKAQPPKIYDMARDTT